MVWPLKKKMTVDSLASIVADAIEENVSVYYEAIRNHAAENVSEQEIARFEPELWAIELSILDVVLPMTQVPEEMVQQLMPILVVGYSPLDKDAYLRRTQYFAEVVSKGSPEKFTINLGQAFFCASGIEYKSERQNVNRKALEWAIATVATGSFQGLLALVSDVSKEYRIY